MTEIPEHLLKRSRERRGAVGLPGGEATGAEGATTAASAPAVAPSAPAARATVAAPAAPKPEPVEPGYIKAAKNRRRIPIWAMPVVVGLPLWGYVYVNAMRPQVQVVQGPLATGAGVYTQCASCHNGDGSGGVGYPLWNTEVIKSFPNIEDQIRFVYNGNKPYAGKAYTPADRAGGAHVGGVRGAPGVMPAWGSGPGGNGLSDAEILGVVCHERFDLADDTAKDTYKAEYDKWCAPDAPQWALVESGGFAAAKVDPSATVAIPSAVKA